MLPGLLVIGLFGLAAIPWIALAGARFGHLLAIPAVGVGLGLTLLGSLLLAAGTRTGAYATAIGTVIAVGLVGAVLCWRGRGRPHRPLQRPSRQALAVWLPASLGSLVWIGTTVAAQFVSGAARLSWAMYGDAANNLFYANTVLDAGGVTLGADSNPVPLTAAIIAVALDPSHHGAGTGALGNDLTMFTVAWTVLLALGCVSLGAVVASAIPAGRLRLASVAGLLGSLLPLTWFVGGMPTHWGYFNASVVLPLLCAAWFAYLSSSRFPVASLCLLAGVSTLMLATWAPLVVLPGALGAVVIVRHWAVLRPIRGLRALALLLAVIQLLIWIAVQSVPSYLQQGDALDAPGSQQAPYPATWVALVVILLVMVALAALWRRREGSPMLGGIVALAVSGVAVVVLLLQQAWDGAIPWSSYYPTKLSWMLCVFFGTLTLSLASGLLARLPSRFAAAAVAALGIAALVLCVVFPTGASMRETATRLPTVLILSGSMWHTGDVAARRIIALSKPGHVGVEWGSDDPDEGIVDALVLVENGAGPKGSGALRAIAFAMYRNYRATGTYDDSDLGTLCAMTGQMARGLTIHTASPSLERRFRASCPARTVRFTVDG